MHSSRPQPADNAAPHPVNHAGCLQLDAASLFASRREVVIIHAGEHYRLRLTRQNKLILTK